MHFVSETAQVELRKWTSVSPLSAAKLADFVREMKPTSYSSTSPPAVAVVTDDVKIMSEIEALQDTEGYRFLKVDVAPKRVADKAGGLSRTRIGPRSYN